MSDPVISQRDAIIHVLALKRLLAGDLESHEPLEILGNRILTIDWNDPSFIEFTRQMAPGLPGISPEAEAHLTTPQQFLDLLKAVLEKAHASDETAKAALAEAKKTGDLIKFTEKLMSVYERMKERLETLGADVSDFEMPDFKP